jgi:AhpD family alkylhydroperoxidase
MFRVIALSPAALEGFLGLNGALSKTLDVRTRERIAIAIAETNGCDYCLSAHTYLGLNLAKITAEDATLAREGSSTDAKAAARSVLRFRSRRRLAGSAALISPL